jgi:hypothetical protein
MGYETLLVDQSDAVLTIAVNRPEVLLTRGGAK